MHAQLTARFVELLIRWRYVLLGIGIALAVFAWFPSRQVRFDQTVERMFPGDDPLLAPYAELKQRYSGNEVVMAVYSDPHAMDPDGSGIERMRVLSEKLQKVPGVEATLSLAEVDSLVGMLKKFSGRGLLGVFGGGGSRDHWDGPPVLNPKSKLSQQFLEVFQGYTHSADGETIAIVCILEPLNSESDATKEPSADQAAETPRARTIREMREIIARPGAGLAPGMLAGEPVMVVEGFKMIELDGRRLGIWSTILLGLTMLVLFRKLRWLLVAIVVVQWALLMTRGTLVVSDMQLTMVTSILTAIVTVIGVAAVMHLIVHFEELRQQGVPPREALLHSGHRLAWPILGASATDLIGFGSLSSAQVGPVNDFGTMMSIGAAFVLAALVLLVPGLTLLPLPWLGRRLGASSESTQAHWSDDRLNRQLTYLVELVERRPVTVAIVSLPLVIVAIVGSARLQVESDFTRNFRRSTDIVRSYEFIESHLGGAGVWDVMIPAPERLDDEYMARVRKLEDRLRAIEVPAVEGTEPVRLTKVISLADVLAAAEAERSMVSLLSPELQARRLAKEMPVFMRALRSTEVDKHGQTGLRIMLRARERQPAEQKRALIDAVENVVREEFPPSDQSDGGKVTGLFVLLTSLVESMLRDQWVTFAVASAGMGLMLWLALRSLKLALIALVPNVLPILLVMGLWGILGLKINMGAAMIAAVSMGLTIDSSMHYLVDFVRARRDGKPFSEALGEVQRSVGRAMIFTTLAVAVGFGVLCISDFIPTVYFGVLVSLTMIGGLAGNLIILPLQLCWFAQNYKPKK